MLPLPILSTFRRLKTENTAAIKTTSREIVSSNRRRIWLLVIYGTDISAKAGFTSFCSISDEVDHDVDVAARGIGIRARLMGGLHQGLSYVALEAWQPDIETSLEKVSSVG